MGDLLKNMRSSQIFSVCGLPEIAVSKLQGGRYQVELLGLDVFDPISMESIFDRIKRRERLPRFLDTKKIGSRVQLRMLIPGQAKTCAK
jgi:hypothetical protein